MYVRTKYKRYNSTLTRELKISYTLEILTSVSTHWYWSTITVTLDSRIRPIAMHYTWCTYTYSSLTLSHGSTS